MSRFVLTAQLQLQAPSNVGQVVRDIQNQLNNVRVNVQVQGTARAQRDLRSITESTREATDAAGRMGRAFAISVRRFTALAVATRAVSLLTNTLSRATEEAINFERELIKVAQVTGETVQNLRGFTNQITELSTGLGVSSASLLNVGTILAQAGLNAQETEIALKTLAKTELSPTFDDITQTAEGVVAIFNQFRQGAEALEQQLSAINSVSAKFAVESADLISVVRRTGGVFKASGGDLNELIALFTSVRATTRESAESIATGLRTIFTRIQRPKTIEFLRQYGVELTTLEGKFVGPFEAVRRLSEALAGLEQGDITFIRIAEELGGFRQIGKVIPLIQQFQVAQEALNVAQQSSSSLSEDATKAQLALAVRITKVREEFLALIRSVSETSTFQLMANTALSLASAFIKVADSIKPLLPLITALATVRLVRGLGSFASNFAAGATSARQYSQGGKVHKFATGGLVPGSGTGDTVPAMLTPGEFVMKKSAVQSIGKSNLTAMNEGGFIKDVIDKKTGGKPSVKNFYDIQKNYDKYSAPNIQRVKLNKSYNEYEDEAIDLWFEANKIYRTKDLTSGYKPVSDKEGSTISKPPTEANKYLKKQTGGNNSTIQSLGFKELAGDRSGQPKPLDLNKIRGALAERDTEQTFIKSLQRLPNKDGSDYFSPKSNEFGNIKIPAKSYVEVKNQQKEVKDKTLIAKSLLAYSSQFGNKKNDKLDIVPPLNIVAVEVNKKNLGGTIQKFALGGESKAGMVVSDILDKQSSSVDIPGSLIAMATPQIAPLKSGSIFSNFGTNKKQVNKDEPNKLPQQDLYNLAAQTIFGASSKDYTTEVAGFGAPQKQSFDSILKTNFQESIKNTASQFASTLGVNLPKNSITFASNFDVPGGSAGTMFEKTIDAFNGQPVQSLAAEDKRPFDYTGGLRGVNERVFNLSKDINYIDAKASASSDNIGSASFKKKISGQLAIENFDNIAQQIPTVYESLLASTGQRQMGQQVTKAVKGQVYNKSDLEKMGYGDYERSAQFTRRKGRGDQWQYQLKNLGGIIQKFATGGIANAPLIDDIIQASGSKLPVPKIAIEDIIKAGGAGVDIDRTLIRTTGDKAYGKARSKGQQDAVLNTYFKNPQRRLSDITSSPLTQFGRELQTSIQSGQINPNTISIVSKSQRVPGVAEYINQLFGIPIANMAFTAGESKEPAMQAIRTKGPRVERVKNFAFGGIAPQKFAFGGKKIKEEKTSSGTLLSALNANSDYSTVDKILGVSGGNKLLAQIEKAYKITSARFLDSGGENVVFDIGNEILKISRTGFGIQQIAKDIGFKKKQVEEIGNYQLPTGLEHVSGYRNVKTFGKLTAAIQDKVKTNDTEKGIRDAELLQGKLASQGLHWIDAGAVNMGYDKKGKPTVIDGMVLSKEYMAKYLSEDNIEDIEGDSFGPTWEWERDLKKRKGKPRFNLGGLVQKFAFGGKANTDYYSLEKDSGLSKFEFDDVVRYAKTNNFSLNEFKNYLSTRVAQKKQKSGMIMEPKSLQQFLLSGTQQRTEVTDAQRSLAQSLMGPVDPQYNPKYDNARKFATGGIVPGTGSRDTVPAMLNAGDFVIRKRSVESIGADKIASMARYASGGSIDSPVPALLTPGEFVVGREQAKTIGYGKLHRMNKFGKYATGGIAGGISKFASGGSVQRFANGGTGIPTSPGLPDFSDLTSSIADLNTNVRDLIDSLRTHRDTVEESIDIEERRADTAETATPPTPTGTDTGGSQSRQSSRELFYVIGTITTINAAMQSFLPPLDDASSGVTRFAHNLTSTITSTAASFATLQGILGEFGVSLTASSVVQFLRTGGGDIANTISQTITRGLGGLADRFAGLGSRLTGDNNTFAAMSGAMGRQARQPSIQRTGFLDNSRQLGNYANAFAGALRGSIGTIAQFGVNLTRIASVAGGVYLAFSTIGSLVKSLLNYEGQLANAIKTGNVERAGQIARSSANFDTGTNIATGGAVAASIGATIGTIFGGPGIGTAIGAAIGSTIGYAFSESADKAEAFAKVQAQGIKTQEALRKGQEDSARAIEDFNNGNISAAQAVNSFAQASLESANLIAANNKAIQANTETRSTGAGSVVRDLLTSFGGGLFGMELSSTRNARLEKESIGLAQQSREQQASTFAAGEATRRVGLRELALRGGTSEQLSTYAVEKGLVRAEESPEALRNKAIETRKESAKALRNGQTDLAAELEKNAKIYSDQARIIESSFANIVKEIETTRKAFDALNLGLSNATGAISASKTAIDNYVASIQPGSISVEQSLNTLTSAVTSAGQGISASDVSAATDDVVNKLREYGNINDEQATKLKGNVEAFSTAQRDLPKTFETLKNRFEDLPGGVRGVESPEKLRDEFIKAQTETLKAGGADDATIKNITEALNKGLDTATLEQIRVTGDISLFAKALEEAGGKQLAEFSKAIEEAAAIEKQLIGLTKQRIDAERSLFEAQKEALSIQLEARNIQAKYGGKVVSGEERRGILAQQANVGAVRLGLSDIGPAATAEDFRRRNQELVARRQSQAVAERTPGGLAGTGGTEQAGITEDLARAQKEQINNIRELIKIQEDELRIIQEKNKQEQASLDALLAGDIDKFFEQQAAVGATAALASGDERLAGAFGPKALGDAFKEIKRLQEAGVQEIYGAQIGGAGGLAEVGAQRALAARGLEGTAGIRAARIAAGTTEEQLQKEAEIRTSADILTEAGKIGIDFAEIQLQSAEIYINEATQRIQGAKSEAAASRQRGEDVKTARRIRDEAEADRRTRDEGARTRGREDVDMAAVTPPSIDAYASVDPRAMENNLDVMGDMGEAALRVGSIYTHDKTTEGLLSKLLTAVGVMSKSITNSVDDIKIPQAKNIAGSRSISFSDIPSSVLTQASDGLTNTASLAGKQASKVIASNVGRFNAGKDLAKMGVQTRSTDLATKAGGLYQRGANYARGVGINLQRAGKAATNFRTDFSRGQNFARMQRLSQANPMTKLKIVDPLANLANVKNAFSEDTSQYLLNSKKASTLGEKAGQFTTNTINKIGDAKKYITNSRLVNNPVTRFGRSIARNSSNFITKQSNNIGKFASNFGADFSRGQSFARMQALEKANPATKLKIIDPFANLNNVKNAFSEDTAQYLLNSKKATTFGEKAGQFTKNITNKIGGGVNNLITKGKDVATGAGKYIAPRAAALTKGAGALGKFGLKALGPIGAIADLGMGAYAGATANSDTRATRDEQGNIIGRNANDQVLDQMSSTEKGIIGALTGSATTGGSLTGGLLGLEQNGSADMFFSGVESVGKGAAIGGTVGGVPGALIGAAVGGGAEVYKNVRQLSIEQENARNAAAKTTVMGQNLQDSRRNSLKEIRAGIGLDPFSTSDNEFSTTNFENLRGIEQNRAMEDAVLTAELRKATQLKESGGTISDLSTSIGDDVSGQFTNLDEFIKQRQSRIAENRAMRAKERNDATYFGLSDAENVDSETFQRGVDERARLYEQQFAANERKQQQMTQPMAAQQIAQGPINIPQSISPEKTLESIGNSADKLQQLTQIIDQLQAAQQSTQPTRTEATGVLRDRAAAPLSTANTQAQQFGGLDQSIIERLTATLEQFNKDFSTNIDRLSQVQLQITLDSTNVNVNLNGAEVLSRLTDSVQQTIMDTVTSELRQYKVINGKLTKDNGVLGK